MDIVTLRVYINSTSEGIRFGAKASCAIPNQVAESQPVFGPLNLTVSELLGGHKVFEVLITQATECARMAWVEPSR